MKSPEQWALELTRQWHKPHWRESRLLGGPDAWPVCLPIGVPDSASFAAASPALREHLERWRRIDRQGPGRVQWTSKKYRAGAAPVDLPEQWILDKPSDWIAATQNSVVASEYALLQQVLPAVDTAFRALLLRRMAVWRELAPAQAILVAQLAMRLAPGCAAGKPLRMLQVAGNDTKFFERHETLLKILLDQRFDGEATRQGLAAFLGALDEREHWLLVVPLEEGLLPFKKLRLASTDLLDWALPAGHILVVENEQSLHQLPRSLPDTIAILGAGLDLGWLSAPWLKSRRVAYWGDMDTWGLVMLGRARQHLPELQNLLMEQAVFDAHAHCAVVEPIQTPDAPNHLQPDEQALYQWLKQQPKGRLEQEFLDPGLVGQALMRWRGTHSS